MLYRQVYDALRDEIRAGLPAVGERLPSEVELTERFDVSVITVKHALDLLRREGYITRRPRVGTLVVSADPAPSGSPAPGGATLIGCVVTSFDDTFGTRVLEGLLDEAGADTHVVVKASNGSVERENELIRALVEAGIAGLILLPSTTRFLPPAALELVMREFPVVVLDRSYADVPVSAVFSDNAASAQRATEYLVDLGHTRLGFVASASEVSTTSERHGGYVRAHAVRHVPLDAARQLTDLTSTLPGSVAPRAEVEAEIDRLTGFVRADPATTGYLVTEYNLAVMLREACLRAGLSVPDDVSIVCFDHPTAFSDRELFRFTHVEQDQPELGRRAVQRLLEQIGGGTGTAVAKIEVPSAFVLAESTAPARRLARHPFEG